MRPREKKEKVRRAVAGKRMTTRENSPLDKDDSSSAGSALVDLMITLGTGEKLSMLEVEFLHLSSA